jgi:Flp pilus assembly protein TadB
MKLYGLEWVPGAAAVGAVLALLIVPSFALIALVVVALAAVAAVVALAGAILAAPYLLVRTVRRRLAERHQSTEGSGPIATAIAQAASVTNRSGLTALEDPS